MKRLDVLLAVSAQAATTLTWLLLSGCAATAEPPRGDKNSRSVRDFEVIVPVLRHPRCMNCHSTGDYPRQGDDGHPHNMDVKRGPDGHGTAAVQCATCHQDHNLVGSHMPPGAPDWSLPPASMPMIWEGLADAQLCRLLKDPSRNGNRTVAEIVSHMRAPLVAWAFHPGEGRTPVPVPYQLFLQKVSGWADNGASCP